MNILSEYLSAISGISESDKEHTHRSALQTLLESIKDELATTHKDFANLSIIHEPNNDKSENKAGAPDFQVNCGFSPAGGGGNLTLGYIENKRVNADLAELINKSNTNPREQIAKYLTLSDNLILTDYLRFLRIAKAPNGKVQITQEITLCTLNEIHATLKSKSALQSKQSELLEFFALFFSSAPKPINNAQEFALCLAQRTKLVKDTLIDNPQNPQITTLYQSFRDILYKDLDFEAFCDSFAQTLTYALFLARLNDEKGEIIDLYNVKKFIPKSFPLIRAMSGFLDNLDELDSLKWLIKEILSIINHIDPAEITKELNKIAQKDLLGNYLHKDPYLHFYETFLSQYDPKLRELRGVYYTPFAVVSFIINAIDFVLNRDFNQTKGLGSALNNDNITLLDFATGTGTFLLEAFRKALDSTPQNSLHYKPKNLLSKFSGFEFLIAPYTIAHLKISQSFKEEFHAPLDDNEKLNILLTNTIYTKSAKDEQNQKSSLFAGMYELAQEFLQSQKLKNEQILIITGKPPYSGASANKGLFEDEVKIAYGLEPSKQNLSAEAQRIIKAYFANPDEKSKQREFKNLFESRRLQNEKNPKWLLDDYVKFIRFAESKVESQDSGIIAIISNHGFIDNPTFRGMRYHLLTTFDKIYILDLHGNAKKKEKSPDGSKDDNVFDIQQGVCISVFVKSGTKSTHPLAPSAREGEQKSSPHTNEKETKSPSPCVSNSNKSPLSCREESQISPLPCGGGLGVGNVNNAGNLAQVYHYDLYGKRKDKYDFLQSNGLDSIAWSVIAPKAPFYLFIPQNESLRDEYDKGISIKDIFIKSGVGICSKRDNIVFQDSREKLKELLLDFATKPSDELRRKYDIGEDSGGWKLEWAINEVKKYKDNLDDFITQCHYRPFDLKWTFYTNQNCGFMARPVYDIFKHFLGVENVGLVCDRGCKLQAIDNIFVANNIIDLHLVGSGSYIFPLYLVESDSRSENFTQSFRAFIDTKYGERFSPEVILGYIYAVLFHKDYREKFLDFLKIDFPRIPFIESKEQFLALSALGGQIIELHLMRGTLESITEPLFSNPQNRNERIEKIAYNAEQKRLYVNESLYFSDVSEEVWGYKIGGYSVCEKYLKSHKGEVLDYTHFERIITTLHESLRVESQIAKIALE
ncbi:type ISP restriction/modification enzyme [Helicobacter sp. MIT 01-3238]|uniref:type ISP restriction/modification enzyme n=1 Tax=Helicobacter sp. MIT 01-3238 TaxID=398627 RepID=UPI002161FB8C|nr:type ISP restriction/modification enzyme [Helicobacter sp. MIT 01-3238]